ncbi:hypothetical protein A2467_02990 [Candidatus Nomurabacteria bacterium RIFOXYC2_FULL_36_8]|nr:MAG: hypothetical protein UR97_C0004G0135 [Candidatus Nomurabacteria bacterium GW2011_GWE2_36_115]KKP94266.1 MAG: hypothetical protein US00_C0003G0190 [Candidatus Nomurabacteria bacterium GW2011_GWF2_36_126]KKP96606.1 MAG: hypothetical protein US04_C0001G0108 [Candidatus Nomurabacteria bacterium GW2011_GWD2_36_14]KKP99790.1 MAG: hypothetical protein US08_C0001G0473 [Candidatus Nomurabacteria bacterium GW2011_GWF2_36_19]KKQ05264.1 MAG: hypothetical protein US17_C0005G0031 [Candidatus Nomuraba
MSKENYLNEFKLQGDPKKFLEKRRESVTHNLTEIKLLIDSNMQEIKKNNGKVLYSFPCKALVFNDESDLKKFDDDIEINSGIFQIKNINIISLETTEDGIQCRQSFGVSFIRNWRDFSSKNVNDDPYPYKFKEEDIPAVIEEDKIMFSNDKKCIHGNNHSFYFVSILKYAEIINFIKDALNYLKNTNLKKVDWSALDLH